MMEREFAEKIKYVIISNVGIMQMNQPISISICRF